MSLELHIRFCWEEKETMSARFENLTRTFETWRGESVSWKGITAKKDFQGNEIARNEGPCSTNETLQFLLPNLNEECKVTAYSNFPCWRFPKDGAEYAAVMVACSSLGNRFGNTVHSDTIYEGEFTILNCSPFFGYLDQGTQSFPPSAENAKVEENLESLLSLLQEFTDKCEPKHWAAFSDDGSSQILINAHACYFESREKLVHKLMEFKSILQHGFPKEALPPIQTLDRLEGTGYHHSFRSMEQEEVLLYRLKNIAASSFIPSIDHLQRTLAGGNYDFIEFGKGLIVLDFPYFLNSFLSDFFVELLESQAI